MGIQFPPAYCFPFPTVLLYIYMFFYVFFFVRISRMHVATLHDVAHFDARTTQV